MRVYHTVLNAFAENVEKQALEIKEQITKFSKDWIQGHTVIICDGKKDEDDKKRLAEMASTKSVLFVIVQTMIKEQVLNYLSETICSKDLYIFGSDAFGQEIAVRLARRTGGSALVGCSDIYQTEDGVYAEKSVYANHMKATYRMEESPCCVSLCKNPCTNVSFEREAGRIIQTVEYGDTDIFVSIREIARENKKEKDGLEEAKLAVIGGRGMGSGEQTKAIWEITKKLQGEFGGSRPVAMNAWIPMDRMVGVSGKMIHPKICITAGLSGAAAFYAGIEKSDKIVAINTDEKAPIMKKADVCLVGDCKSILEELEKLVNGEGADE